MLLQGCVFLIAEQSANVSSKNRVSMKTIKYRTPMTYSQSMTHDEIQAISCPLAGKFSSFDTAIALPGDVDGQRGVLEAVADGVGDDGITDHFAPVIER
jgi:hypothetical protein